jgi:hypothetical protein
MSKQSFLGLACASYFMQKLQTLLFQLFRKFRFDQDTNKYSIKNRLIYFKGIHMTLSRH